MNLRPKFISLSVAFSGIALFVCLSTFSFLVAGGGPQTRPNYTPKDGFVPDEKTAIAIAEAVLIPVYGEKQIRSEEPFSARLNDDIWHVSGTLPKPYDKGGVAEVEISKSKGCILHMIHGK